MYSDYSKIKGNVNELGINGGKKKFNQQQIKIWCQKYGQMGIQLSNCNENIVGKGEIARYKQFLLFPQSFLKWCPWL